MDINLSKNQVCSVEVIFCAAQIASAIDGLAQKISNRNINHLLAVPILTGSFVFASDLIRALHHYNVAPEIDFLSLSSYQGNQISSGEVKIVRDLNVPVQGRNVMIIDDILESGRTLSFAQKYILDKGADSVLTCVLLNKLTERAVQIEADFYAFECPNVFVVGYGMDLDYRLRELPFIGQVVSQKS